MRKAPGSGAWNSFACYHSAASFDVNRVVNTIQITANAWSSMRNAITVTNVGALIKQVA
jgi:hypothetical protein